MLDVRLLSSKRPKTKRVTHSVKETGLIGGYNLVALTALKEQGAMCRNQLSEATGMTKSQASGKLQDLLRHELIEKTGAMNGKRHVYRAKRKGMTMDKVQEIMALVDDFKDAWTEFLSVDDERLKSAEEGVKKSLGEIESKLRALLERKPLDAHQRMEVLHAIPDDDDAEEEWMLTDKQIQLIIDGVERAHGIGA